MMTETMTADKMTEKADKMMTDKMTVDILASVDVVDVRFDIMVAVMAMGRARWHVVIAFMFDRDSC